MSDDDRLIGAVGALATGLRELWRSHRIDERAAAIGGCLVAAGLEPFHSYAADAIDELERLVARTYEPGEVFGDTADQVRTASTLLTAYALSGRLPYSMLAEELIQPMRTGGAAGPTAFAVSCEGARVLCRLANLHDDPEYRAAAILAPGVDYRLDAERVLRGQMAPALQLGAAGAIYGVALLELESGFH